MPIQVTNRKLQWYAYPEGYEPLHAFCLQDKDNVKWYNQPPDREQSQWITRPVKQDYFNVFPVIDCVFQIPESAPNHKSLAEDLYIKFRHLNKSMAFTIDETNLPVADLIFVATRQSRQGNIFPLKRELTVEDVTMSWEDYQNRLMIKLEQAIYNDEALKTTINGCRANIKTYESKMLEEITKMIEAETLLRREKNAVDKLKEFIWPYEIIDETIILTTPRITTKLGANSYYLGEFRIELNFGKTEVHVYNTALTANNRHHPHVYSDNRCCFGSLKSKVIESMKRFDIGTLQAILELFMYKLNPNSFASDLRPFPMLVNGYIENTKDVKWLKPCQFRQRSTNETNNIPVPPSTQNDGTNDVPL